MQPPQEQQVSACIFFTFPSLICDVYHAHGHHGYSPAIPPLRETTLHPPHPTYLLLAYTLQTLPGYALFILHIRIRHRHRGLRHPILISQTGPS
jgi:hypothetical protein